MKKFYESPIVEFTVFDVEDVITTSVGGVNTINTLGLSEDEIYEIADELYAANGTVADYYGAYEW